MYMYVWKAGNSSHPYDSLWGVGKLWEYIEVKDDGDLSIDGTEGASLFRTNGASCLVKAVIQLLETALQVGYDWPIHVHVQANVKEKVINECNTKEVCSRSLEMLKRRMPYNFEHFMLILKAPSYYTSFYMYMYMRVCVSLNILLDDLAI